MKPIIEKENQDTILTSEITGEHIVVGYSNTKAPMILTRKQFREGTFSFRLLNDVFTNGNGYYDFDTIEEATNDRIDENSKIEVFEEKDWKKALQWLIDNAE